SQPSPDPYHGQETVAKLCARFVSHLFAYSELLRQPVAPTATPIPRLDHFIAYVLHRTRLHPSVTFAALYLLQRLKTRFPNAKGTSGRRLFISAFMIASKVICDDTFSNKSWCIVSQGIFPLREINQMEREMCRYLEWQLTLDPVTLGEFEATVR
ncbi:cyclin-like protein, partial [Artomyces pyxidatus]